jgi:hypothetical protein
MTASSLVVAVVVVAILVVERAFLNRVLWRLGVTIFFFLLSCSLSTSESPYILTAFSLVAFLFFVTLLAWLFEEDSARIVESASFSVEARKWVLFGVRGRTGEIGG